MLARSPPTSPPTPSATAARRGRRPSGGTMSHPSSLLARRDPVRDAPAASQRAALLGSNRDVDRAEALVVARLLRVVSLGRADVRSGGTVLDSETQDGAIL